MIRFVALFLLIPAAAWAFDPVTDGHEFRQLVQGQELTRSGIRLQVLDSGQITGRGMGRTVSGEWEWRDGYFCRTLFWGDTDLGADCQAVLRQGDELRFVSERGAGMGASFRLR